MTVIRYSVSILVVTLFASCANLPERCIHTHPVREKVLRQYIFTPDKYVWQFRCKDCNQILCDSPWVAHVCDF